MLTRTLLLTAICGLVLAFQNCSPVGFSTDSSTVAKAAGDSTDTTDDGTVPDTDDPAAQCACQNSQPEDVYVHCNKIHVTSKSGVKHDYPGPGLIKSKDLANYVKSKKSHDDDDVDVDVDDQGSQVKCSDGSSHLMKVDTKKLKARVRLACAGHDQSGSSHDEDDGDDDGGTTTTGGACPSFPTTTVPTHHHDGDGKSCDGGGTSSSSSNSWSSSFGHH